jgi:hypothetical protein
MVSVKYGDLIEAFDFVSFGGSSEHAAYISLDTGAIYWDTESGEEELPDDLGESDRYLALPHKNDLDLGRDLALRFAAGKLPNDYGRVEDFFRRPGAYARFKDLLEAQGRLDDWYAFEAAETEVALKDWCRDNDIQIIDDRPEPPA